ncbi:hypothetical protein GCM10009097_58820 [Pigmentiphaga daeguensis]|uniref:Glycosyl transferase family 4 n=1 Tax=Pigmentiphaga daeguensis TaxID=414049 RepID=A0ABN1D5J9_9BURK
MIGATLGFLVWNYPFGHVFLGDGGAYLLGFMLAELAILLVMRNPQISAWYPALLFSYPIVETTFSIYRKRCLRGMPPSQPDGVHLHMLVYKRVIRWAVGSHNADQLLHRNAATSPYLWALTLLAAVPATLAWNNEKLLAACLAIFVAIYLWLYFAIVRFRTPRWMILRERRKPSTSRTR